MRRLDADREVSSRQPRLPAHACRRAHAHTRFNLKSRTGAPSVGRSARAVLNDLGEPAHLHVPNFHGVSFKSAVAIPKLVWAGVRDRRLHRLLGQGSSMVALSGKPGLSRWSRKHPIFTLMCRYCLMNFHVAHSQNRVFMGPTGQTYGKTLKFFFTIVGDLGRRKTDF